MGAGCRTDHHIHIVHILISAAVRNLHICIVMMLIGHLMDTIYIARCHIKLRVIIRQQVFHHDATDFTTAANQHHLFTCKCSDIILCRFDCHRSCGHRCFG